MENSKLYLGDGAFVEHFPVMGELVIYSTNGLKKTNTVYIESTSIKDLYEFLGKLLEK